MTGPEDEEAVEARLFGIECKLSQLERLWHSLDAHQLIQLTQHVEQNCNQVIALSASQERAQNDEALQSMFVARVASGISATAAEIASVNRALAQLEQTVPSRLQPDKYEEQLRSVQRRTLTQIEAAENIDEMVKEIEGRGVLSASLPQLQALRQSADTTAERAARVLSRSRGLALKKEMQQARSEWAVNHCSIQLLLKLANAAGGRLELQDAKHVSDVLAALCRETAELHADRPPPEQIAELQRLAQETRSECDQQQAAAHKMLVAAGAGSEYEQATLVGIVEAVQEQIATASARAAKLEQHLEAEDEGVPPDSTEASLDACAEHLDAVEATVDMMRVRVEEHQDFICEMYELINEAKAKSEEVASPQMAALGRVRKAVNAITAAQRLSGAQPQDNTT